MTQAQASSTEKALPSEVLKNLRTSRDEAVLQLELVQAEARKGGDNVFELVGQAETLKKQIASLNASLNEKTTGNVAGIADAIKAFCLGNAEIKAYFNAGGKSLYARSDNGTISVGTVERIARGPRKTGTTRTRTDKVQWGSDVYSDFRVIHTKLGKPRDGESEAQWQARLTKDFQVKFL